MTRERLAQRAHCSVIALKRIESGSLRPSRGQLRLAARLCGVLQKLSDSDVTLLQADQAEFERTLAALRAQMEDAAFEQARAEGRRVTLDEAIGLVLAETES